MIWLILISIFIVFLYLGYLNNKKLEEQKKQRGKELRQKLQAIDNLTITKKITGIDNTYVLAVDQENQNVIFLTENTKKIFPFNQLICVEVIEDNTVISQKSSLRTIGGAVVGGVIAGGAGAIVGGLSGDSQQNKKVSKVQVKLKLRDIKNPSFTIDCFDCKTMILGGEPVKPNSGMDGNIYKKGLQDALTIVDTLGVIIDANDRITKDEHMSHSLSSNTHQTNSVADELTKLLELKEKGILTETEFNNQKQLLLNSTSESSNI